MSKRLSFRKKFCIFSELARGVPLERRSAERFFFYPLSVPLERRIQSAIRLFMP